MRQKINESFALDDQRNSCADLKFSVFTGISGIFQHEFGIQVNDCTPIPISFFGENRVQTVTLLDMNQKTLNDIDEVFEYDCLRKMFKLVDRIQATDEEVKIEDVLKVKMHLKAKADIKESRRKPTKKRKDSSTVSSDFSAGDSVTISSHFELFYDVEGKAVWQQKPVTLYSGKMLQAVDELLESFLVVDYPDEYPNAIEITNFIAQQGLAESLKCDETFQEFKAIYERHAMEKLRQRKLKKVGDHQEIEEAIVVPLPLVLQQYQIDFGMIAINECVERVVQFYFHGDQLVASLRTDADFPSLSMTFLESAAMEASFKVINYESTKQQNVYRNRYQREADPVAVISMRRCHSFDFTDARVHSRKLPLTPRVQSDIKQHYNDVMNCKINEERNAFVQSEIFQKSRDSIKIFSFKIKFAPTLEHYEPDSEVDEIVYLDVSIEICLAVS